MTSTPKVLGSGVHWGVSTTSVTSFATLILNDASQQLEVDTATATDAVGYVVTEVGYNHKESGTLSGWISGSAGSASAPITPALMVNPGDQITVVDAVDTLLSGSTWIVSSGVSVTRVATDLAKYSFGIHRYAKI